VQSENREGILTILQVHLAHEYFFVIDAHWPRVVYAHQSCHFAEKQACAGKQRMTPARNAMAPKPLIMGQGELPKSGPCSAMAECPPSRIVRFHLVFV